MKTAFTTLACPELSLKELLDLASRNGMDAVEIRLGSGDTLCGYSLEALDEAKALFDQSGVALSDLATGITIKDGDRAVLSRMEHCAKMAQRLGAVGIRIFLGRGAKYFTDPIDRDLDGVAAVLREGAELVAGYGVELWIETHSDYSTGAILREVLDRTNDSRVKVIWDVIHSVEWRESLEETVRLIGDSIVHIHLKDGTAPADPNRTAYDLCALGAGDLDICAIAKVLGRIGYDGYLSLEWELMWHPELAACYADTDALLGAYREWITPAL